MKDKKTKKVKQNRPQYLVIYKETEWDEEFENTKVFVKAKDMEEFVLSLNTKDIRVYQIGEEIPLLVYKYVTY